MILAVQHQISGNSPYRRDQLQRVPWGGLGVAPLATVGRAEAGPYDLLAALVTTL
jgi:hypothetical protein